ncbi:MAG: hypothetical protein LIR46_02850 [Bacteroidota bacterium]|nr:hypothetical protein [Bacteroidota bacterium]
MGLFGLPTIRTCSKIWFETPEEAESWVKENANHIRLVAAYKEGSKMFKEYRYDEAVMQNTDMSMYKAVVLYHWLGRIVNE